jgi:putative heme-binding domain-containing protein
VQRNGLAILGTLGSWERARFAARASELLWSSDARTALLALGALREDVGPAELARLLAEFPALEDDWRRSAVLALGARDPAGFVRACLQSPAATGLAPLTETIGRELARRADLKQAVEIVLVLAEHAQRAPALAEGLLRSCSALTEKPWPSPRLDAALTRLVAGDSLSVAIAALPLAERWGQSSKLHEALAALATRLGALVSAPDQPLELRLRALESMLALPGQRSVGIELAPAFLDPIHPLDCQLRVIEALGGLTDARASSALCASFEQLSQPARERVFARLVEREESTAILLDALESAEILFTELGPQRLHRLRQHPVPALAARANQLFDRLGGAERSDKDALLSELVPLVEGPGDRGRGRTVFEQNCANCHTVKGVETRGGVGPDLTGMGARGARELLPFLIDPNRAVDPAYLEYALTTTDGRLVDGVIVREDERSLLLRNSSGETEVARTEIASLRSTGRSPMPTGFESLGPEALRDLVAFLAGDYSGFRLLDLRPLANASATRGLYDQTRDAKPMRFARYGVVEALGVPFEVLDPARMDGEKNALVLRGGLAEGWESKGYAQRAEIPLGFALRRLHVLGGIAAWGFPYTKTRAPIVKLTWRYADGTSEEQVLADGAEFADWIGRHEVPGSTWVDLLDGESWGQVRVFALTPGRPGELLEALVLESFDNHLAPTFLALTAELEDRTVSERTTPAPRPEPGILIFGGGSSHDFERWFAREDSATLAPLGRALSYSEDPAELATALSGLDVLVLCNNQPLVDPTLRRALFDFVLSGGGLALVHPATWYNWPDWPEYNRELVGGGAKSHEDFAEFRVTLTGREHPLLAGVPAEFTITDELYRFEPDASVPSHVLALGRSLSSGEEYPVLWTRGFGDGRIVGLTLGHDGAAHEHPAYRRLLANAVGWLAEGP